MVWILGSVWLYQNCCRLRKVCEAVSWAGLGSRLARARAGSWWPYTATSYCCCCWGGAVLRLTGHTARSSDTSPTAQQHVMITFMHSVTGLTIDVLHHGRALHVCRPPHPRQDLLR